MLKRLIRDVIVEYLQEEGFDTLAACDGAEALQLARAQPPDVAVIDVMMPRMDGRAVVTSWAQDPALQAIPVVLVSATTGLIELARQLQVRAALAKPFDLDVLRVIVEQLLAHPEPPPETPTVHTE